MELIDAINNRRSLREFVEWKQVDKSDIENVLKSAMQAPSAYNQQAWKFIVVNDRTIINKLSEKHPHALMLKTAPTLLIVCGIKDKIKSQDFWIQDCAAATQNILLTSTNLNLWAVWCWVYPKQELVDIVAEIVWLDDDIIPFSLVAIWHPSKKNFFIDRYQKDRIVWM